MIVTVMASLRRLPNSPYWIACFSLPDGRQTQRSTKTTDRREAQRVANNFEDASREGRAGRLTEHQARKVIADIFAIANKDQLPSSTIRDFCTSWLQRKELESEPRTHERYTTAIGHFLDFMGSKAERDLSHLGSKEVIGMRDQLAQKLSANSANYTVKVLRAALNQARRDGLVDVNEASRVTLIKQNRQSVRRPFTLGELKMILNVANNEWRGMILVGLYTGLRLGDVATLEWNNVDLQNQEISIVTQKTGRQQITPLTAPLLRYLEALPAGDDPNSPIFPDAYALKRRNPSGGPLSNQFYQILVSAGLAIKRTHKSQGKGRDTARQITEISFHSLRHTATSLLKNAGVSDVVARDIIGHDSAAVSANYTHIDQVTKRRALENMPDVTADK